MRLLIMLGQLKKLHIAIKNQKISLAFFDNIKLKYKGKKKTKSFWRNYGILIQRLRWIVKLDIYNIYRAVIGSLKKDKLKQFGMKIRDLV